MKGHKWHGFCPPGDYGHKWDTSIKQILFSSNKLFGETKENEKQF